MKYSTLLILMLHLALAAAFVVQNRELSCHQLTNTNSLQKVNHAKGTVFPAALENERKSVAAIQTMGLFGLGLPEIALILVAGAFVIGPDKLRELGRDAGKMTKEMKEVPKSFKTGLDEGEVEARSKKAKPMERTKEDTDE
jgi:sec-independent protein translocase protein TatA